MCITFLSICFNNHSINNIISRTQFKYNVQNTLIIFKIVLTVTQFDGNIKAEINEIRTRKRGETVINVNVRSIRLAKGISGSHVAKALGITPAGYYAIETGKVELKAEHLKTIATLLGESAEVFFDQKLTKSVLSRLKREGATNERTRRKRSKGA